MPIWSPGRHIPTPTIPKCSPPRGMVQFYCWTPPIHLSKFRKQLIAFGVSTFIKQAENQNSPHLASVGPGCARYKDSELSSNLTFVRNRKLQLFNLGPSQSHSVFYISFIWFPPPSTKAILISCYFGLILFTLDTFLNSPLWVFEMVHTARNRPIFVYYNYFLISIALAFSNQVKETPILNIERI